MKKTVLSFDKEGRVYMHKGFYRTTFQEDEIKTGDEVEVFDAKGCLIDTVKVLEIRFEWKFDMILEKTEQMYRHWIKFDKELNIKIYDIEKL